MKTLVAFLLSFVLVLSCAQAQWMKVGQKSGGQVNGLEINKYGTLFCSFGNRVYRSIDGGNAWSARIVPTELIQRDNLYTSADTAVTHAVLLRTGADSVYRSTNEGDTWELMTGLQDALGKKKLWELFATRYGDLYAGSSDGTKVWLWKSRDNGNSFTSVLSETDQIAQVYQAEDSLIYIVQQANIIRIKTDGSMQTLSGVGVSSLTSTRDFAGAPVVLYGIKNGQPHRSKDFGATWTAVPFSTTQKFILYRPLVGAREGEVYAFTQNDKKDSTTIHRLSAGGSQWTAVRTLATSLSYPLMLQNGTFLASASDGMYLSEDGSSWTNSSQGIESYPLLMAATVNANTMIAGGFRGQVFNSVSQGQLWGNSFLPVSLTSDVPFTSVYVSSKATVLLSTEKGLLYSNDQGSNFVECLVNGKPYNNNVSTVVELPGNELLCATQGDSAFIRSTDGGLNWQQVGKAATVLGSNLLTDNAGNILINALQGIMKVDRSNYSLSPFEYQGKIMPFFSTSPNGSLFTIERMVQGSNFVYKLHRKKQGGSDEVFDLPEGLDDYLHLASSYRGDAYVTTEQGLYVLPAAAAALSKVDFFRNDLVTYIARERGGTMIAATAFGGIYVDTSGVVSVEEDASNELADISFYPNPATSHITVESKHQALLSLSLCDILGNEVAHITDGTGSTRLRLATTGIASGSYLLSVQTRDGIQRRTVFITK